MSDDTDLHVHSVRDNSLFMKRSLNLDDLSSITPRHGSRLVDISPALHSSTIGASLLSPGTLNLDDSVDWNLVTDNNISQVHEKDDGSAPYSEDFPRNFMLTTSLTDEMNGNRKAPHKLKFKDRASSPPSSSHSSSAKRKSHRTSAAAQAEDISSSDERGPHPSSRKSKRDNSPSRVDSDPLTFSSTQVDPSGFSDLLTSFFTPSRVPEMFPSSTDNTPRQSPAHTTYSRGPPSHLNLPPSIPPLPMPASASSYTTPVTSQDPQSVQSAAMLMAQHYNIDPTLLHMFAQLQSQLQNSKDSKNVLLPLFLSTFQAISAKDQPEPPPLHNPAAQHSTYPSASSSVSLPFPQTRPPQLSSNPSTPTTHIVHSAHNAHNMHNANVHTGHYGPGNHGTHTNSSSHNSHPNHNLKTNAANHNNASHTNYNNVGSHGSQGSFGHQHLPPATPHPSRVLPQFPLPNWQSSFANLPHNPSPAQASFAIPDLAPGPRSQPKPPPPAASAGLEYDNGSEKGSYGSEAHTDMEDDDDDDGDGDDGEVDPELRPLTQYGPARGAPSFRSSHEQGNEHAYHTAPPGYAGSQLWPFLPQAQMGPHAVNGPYMMQPSSQPTDCQRETQFRKFVCPDCGKRYKQKSHLIVHRRTHDGVRPFTCNFDKCGKSFVTNSALRAHMRVHSGERPYVCVVSGCGRMFSTNSNLRRHERTHLAHPTAQAARHPAFQS